MRIAVYYRAMLTKERKGLLLQRLKQDGRIIAKDVARELKLSEDSIRRDLRELAAERLLTRVHGGALPASPTVANLALRRSMAVEEKSALAVAAVKLLRPGQTIFLDGGTTHMELVRALPTEFVCTVFTHSPAIAAALEFHTHADVVVLGGRLFRHSMVTTGAATLQAIREVRFDLFFLGVTGVHAMEGLTTGDYEEAVIKRAIMARAADTYSLVTQEKVGAASPHKIAEVDALSALVVANGVKTGSLDNAVQVIRA